MPMPESSTSISKRCGVALRLQPKAHGNTTLLGKFHRVADQIDQHLTQARLVALDIARKFRRLVDQQLQPFLLGAHMHHIGDIAHQTTEIKGGVLQLHPAGFDLGHFQHIVDQGQQMFAAAVDDVEVLALLL